MKEYFCGFFDRLFHGGNIMDFTLLELICIITVCILIIWIFYAIEKVLVRLNRKLWKALRRHLKKTSAKAKCESITCPYCGRSLATCICKSNAGKSYKKRLRNYKKYVKAQKVLNTNKK